MELETHVWSAKSVKSGAVDSIALASGEYLQIRHGTLADPVVELEEQCPAGKAWTVRIIVEITETNA